MTEPTSSLPIRREPPPFRTVGVSAITPLSPRMVRITLAGDDLGGLEINEPAASVRLLIPSGGTDELVIPAWNGNEFLLPDGSRPVIRTFTPRRLDAVGFELDLDVVIHEDGKVSTWVESAETGSVAAISGPGRGYRIDPDASGFVLAGDETAIPAISQLLEEIPAAIPIQVIIEVVEPSARVTLPSHARAATTWVDLDLESAPGDALVPCLLLSGLSGHT